MTRSVRLSQLSKLILRPLSLYAILMGVFFSDRLSVLNVFGPIFLLGFPAVIYLRHVHTKSEG